jgi:hypothetical protein
MARADQAVHHRPRFAPQITSSQAQEWYSLQAMAARLFFSTCASSLVVMSTRITVKVVWVSCHHPEILLSIENNQPALSVARAVDQMIRETLLPSMMRKSSVKICSWPKEFWGTAGEFINLPVY